MEGVSYDEKLSTKTPEIEVRNEESSMSWLKFLIYLGCFVLGGYYFKKIMVGKDEGV